MNNIKKFDYDENILLVDKKLATNGLYVVVWTRDGKEPYINWCLGEKLAVKIYNDLCDKADFDSGGDRVDIIRAPHGKNAMNHFIWKGDF